VGDRTLSASLVPLPEAVAAEAYQLEAVATAITRDEIGVARQLLGRIDRDALWSYYDTAGEEWGRRHRREDHLGGSATNRRRIPDATKLEVATRDGWRCRYCGVRLISFDFSRKLNELFPDVWVIDPAIERKMHPVVYLFRYTQGPRGRPRGRRAQQRWQPRRLLRHLPVPERKLLRGGAGTGQPAVSLAHPGRLGGLSGRFGPIRY
jgi:hypothetical protein